MSIAKATKLHVIVRQGVDKARHSAECAYGECEAGFGPITEDCCDGTRGPVREIVKAKTGKHTIGIGRRKSDSSQAIIQSGAEWAIVESAAIRAAGDAEPGHVVIAKDRRIQQRTRLPPRKVTNPSIHIADRGRRRDRPRLGPHQPGRSR